LLRGTTIRIIGKGGILFEGKTPDYLLPIIGIRAMFTEIMFV
jgi:hypothetical protein